MSHKHDDPANVLKGYLTLQKTTEKIAVDLKKAEQTIRNLELENEKLRRLLAQAQSAGKD